MVLILRWSYFLRLFVCKSVRIDFVGLISETGLNSEVVSRRSSTVSIMLQLGVHDFRSLIHCNWCTRLLCCFHMINSPTNSNCNFCIFCSFPLGKWVNQTFSPQRQFLLWFAAHQFLTNISSIKLSMPATSVIISVIFFIYLLSCVRAWEPLYNGIGLNVTCSCEEPPFIPETYRFQLPSLGPLVKIFLFRMGGGGGIPHTRALYSSCVTTLLFHVRCTDHHRSG